MAEELSERIGKLCKERAGHGYSFVAINDLLDVLSDAEQKTEADTTQKTLDWLEKTAALQHESYVKLAKRVKELEKKQSAPHPERMANKALTLARGCRERKVHEEWPALEPFIRWILNTVGETL